MHDTVIRDARVVTPDGVLEGHVGIRDGVIDEVTTGAPGPARRVIDAGGRPLLPGVIDPHTHPGLVAPLERRLPLESRAAAAGGVTTLITYLRRPDSYRTALPARRQVAEQQLLQDFAIHVTLLRPEHLDEVAYCLDAGVTSFKVYMNSRHPLATRMRMDAMPGQQQNETASVDFDHGFFKRVFETLQPYDGVRLNVHCEDSDIVAAETRRVSDHDAGGLAAWDEARPAIAEAVAIHVAATLSRHYGVPLYLPHIGNSVAIRALSEARLLGTSIVAETCPHYLEFTREAGEESAKVSPPIRSESDQRAVKAALAEGVLNTLGSDDIPYTRDEKQLSAFWEQNTAFSGCGLLLPVALTSGLSLDDVARVTSAEPAAAFGLATKGAIRPGADADVVLVDPDLERAVSAADLHGSSDFSVYDGKVLRGWPILTLSRGDVIFDAGRFPLAPGRGRYLARRYTERATSGEMSGAAQ